MTRIEQFIRALRSPKLTPIDGMEIESDENFRKRLLAVCIPADEIVIAIAGPYQLDAIGNVYGLMRHGLH